MLFTVIGTVGAFLMLFGFYRISVGKWTGKSFWYELDNFFGASLLAIYQIHNKVYIPVVINAVWAIVAFRGMSSYAERRLAERNTSRRRQSKR
jgi:hypothetical protein